MTALAQTAQPSALAVFRNRSFTLLWTGQFISAMGSSFTALASSILVYRITGSALSVGLMMLATALPSLFVGLIAGVFVDRYDRRRIMIASDLVRAGLVLLIAVLAPRNIAWLYVLTMLAAAVTQFFDPAHASLLPELATDEELAAANSMMALSSLGSTAIGLAASGLIASRFPIQWAFYIDAGTFVVSAICISLIRVAPMAVQGKTNVETVVRNLRAGINVILEKPILRSLFLVYLPVFLCIGLGNALLLPFAMRALHATEFEFGLLAAAEAVGYVIGSVVLARYSDRLHEGQWLAVSFAGMGLVAMSFATMSRVVPALLLIAMSGMINIPSVIGRQLIIQRNTDREMRGRVFSAFFVLRDVIFIAGMAAAGLADIFDVRVLLLLNGLVMLSCGVVASLLPGIGTRPAEWRRTMALLRGVQAAPGLGLARATRVADFDLLAAQLPVLNSLSPDERADLMSQTLVADARAGVVILRRGEQSDAAYFIITGRAVAGLDEDGGYRLLEVLNAGDFFGEIAAITGVPRTANVVAEEESRLLQVPAPVIRHMMDHPELNQLFLMKMQERMGRMNMLDLPRFGGINQQYLRELRTSDAGRSPAPEPAAG